METKTFNTYKALKEELSKNLGFIATLKDIEAIFRYEKNVFKENESQKSKERLEETILRWWNYAETVIKRHEEIRLKHKLTSFYLIIKLYEEYLESLIEKI